MFEMKPQLVVSPTDGADVAMLVKLAAEMKPKIPNLSLTARSAGTDMSGGAINESVIVDFKKHFTKIEKVTPTSAQAQPGVFLPGFRSRNLAPKSFNAYLPCQPRPLYHWRNGQ